MIELIDSYLNDLKSALNAVSKETVQQIAETLIDARNRGACVFVFGNGGSGSTASHWACDLAKGTLVEEDERAGPPLRVVSLTDNNALITAWANDFSYEDIFAEQLRSLAQKGDVAVGVSASGMSENVLRAARLAKEIGCRVVGVTGFGGGELARVSDIAFVADSSDYGVVEDLHLTLNHILRLILYMDRRKALRAD